MKAVASTQAQKAPATAKIPVPGAKTGILAAYAAAGCWIALGLESIIRPEQENYRDWLWLVPFLLTMLTFYFVHLVQSGVGQNMERAGFYFVMVASVLALLGNLGVSLEQRTLSLILI